MDDRAVRVFHARHKTRHRASGQISTAAVDAEEPVLAKSHARDPLNRSAGPWEHPYRRVLCQQHDLIADKTDPIDETGVAYADPSQLHGRSTVAGRFPNVGGQRAVQLPLLDPVEHIAITRP